VAAARAAHVGALGAALAQMVAGLTAGRKKYAAVDAEMRELALTASGLVTTLSTLVARDADAYGAVSTAYKLPSEPEDARTRASSDQPMRCSRSRSAARKRRALLARCRACRGLRE